MLTASAIITVFLFAYLFIALTKPEIF
ncbi:MAG: K(+)-transporting ATPase subunit F [Alphaproteobacteria bacterium]